MGFDDLKVGIAYFGTIGITLLEIDTVMQVMVTGASLFYIILRCIKLIRGKENGKD